LAPPFATNRERCTLCVFGEMWTVEFHRLGADCRHPNAATWPHMERWSDGTMSIRPDGPPCPHFEPRTDSLMSELDAVNGG